MARAARRKGRAVRAEKQPVQDRLSQKAGKETLHELPAEDVATLPPPEEGTPDEEVSWNPLKMWKDVISRSPLLSAEEEDELVPKAQRGDERAFHRLVESNLRLVIKIAWGYYRSIQDRSTLSVADLIQEGSLGLMHAISKFDPKQGARFATYAHYWIRQAIELAIWREISPLSLSRVVARQLKQLSEAKERLSRTFGSVPTVEELAKASRLPLATVETLLRWVPDVVSLDHPLGSEEDVTLREVVADENDLSPEEVVYRRELKEGLERALNSLKPREREVLTHRFELNGKEHLTLQDLARRLRISRQRVRSIEQQALSKLRRHKGLEHFK